VRYLLVKVLLAVVVVLLVIEVFQVGKLKKFLGRLRTTVIGKFPSWLGKFSSWLGKFSSWLGSRAGRLKWLLAGLAVTVGLGGLAQWILRPRKSIKTPASRPPKPPGMSPELARDTAAADTSAASTKADVGEALADGGKGLADLGNKERGR